MTNLYRTLVAVVESATLVDAAQTLHLTQPTVTRQLQQLEKLYDIPLFDRVGKHLLLNRAGEQVYAVAKRVLTLEQKLREDLGGLADPAVGTVHLGVGITPSLYLLPRVLTNYRHIYPRVKFQVKSLSSREACQALLAHDIDLGIVTTFEENAELAATPLYVDDLLFVVAKDHPLARKAVVSTADFRSITFVLMPESSALREMIDGIAGQIGIQLEVAMETDSLESINRMVQAGMGASILPRSAVQEEVLAGKLAVLPLAHFESAERRTIRLVRRREGILPACTLQFATMLAEIGKAGNLNPK